MKIGDDGESRGAAVGKKVEEVYRKREVRNEGREGKRRQCRGNV